MKVVFVVQISDNETLKNILYHSLQVCFCVSRLDFKYIICLKILAFNIICSLQNRDLTSEVTSKIYKTTNKKTKMRVTRQHRIKKVLKTNMNVLKTNLILLFYCVAQILTWFFLFFVCYCGSAFLYWVTHFNFVM